MTSQETEALARLSSGELGDLPNRLAQRMNDADSDVDSLTRKRYAFRKADGEAQKRLLYESWEPPEPDRSSTLALDVAAAPENIAYCVYGLLGAKHNATVTGQYKTGKTLLMGNLAASVVDGTPFLGEFLVPEAEPVAFWNMEMDRDDFVAYMRSLGIRNLGNIATLHLRGKRMPLLSDPGLDWTVEWLLNAGAKRWFNDSWGRLCAGSGISENDNSAVLALCAAVDEVNARAGTQFVTTLHTGRAQMEEGNEHGRGATALDDWVDSRWVYTRRGTDRFLMVEGRKVKLDECRVVIDPASGVLNLDDLRANRRTAHVDDGARALLQFVSDNPGANGTALRNALTAAGVTNTDAQSQVIAAVLRDRRLVAFERRELPAREQDGKHHKAKFHYLPTHPVALEVTQVRARTTPGMQWS